MRTIPKRIYWRDWKRLRHIFPGQRGETCADYYSRAVKYLEELKGDLK